MKVNATITHTTTHVINDDLPGLAEFLTAKLYDWASGRRDGEFDLGSKKNWATIQFRDITAFTVEVTA